MQKGCEKGTQRNGFAKIRTKQVFAIYILNPFHCINNRKTSQKEESIKNKTNL